MYPELQELGLHKNEITVYLFLLRTGIATPPRISKMTNIGLSNCYHILDKLKEKALIEEQMKGKRKAYVAIDPNSLIRLIETRKRTIEKIVPELRKLFEFQEEKPSMQFFEGEIQVRELYIRLLTEKKDAFYGIGEKILLDKLGEDFMTEYGDFLQRKITWKSVHRQANLQEVRAHLLIVDEYVGIVVYGAVPFGTIYKSKELAKMIEVFYSLL